MMKIFQKLVYAFFLIVINLIIQSCQTSPQESTTSVQITSQSHHDEGPEDRYSIPYEPITYNQTIKAPLPGLAKDYKIIDWDGDGLLDILAVMRRGEGLVFYKNVGSKNEPLYKSLQENEVLLSEADFGSFFAAIDIDGNGTQELITYSFEETTTQKKQCTFYTYSKEQGGKMSKTSKRKVNILESFTMEEPKLTVGDWNGDGLDDLIAGFYLVNDMVGDTIKAGFRDTSSYETQIGNIAVFINQTKDVKNPKFSAPELVELNDQPLKTYVNPYPLIFDHNQDGLMDLLVGTHEGKITVYLNAGSPTQAVLKEGFVLKDEKGDPVHTFLNLRADEGDIDGDGVDELITCSYHGNQNRYVVRKRTDKGWMMDGYLQIQAKEGTPVYGMGNSTVDPVDWDGDGDTDLLLGAEGSFPTIVFNIGDEKNRIFNPAERLKYTDGSLVETFSIVEGVGSYWGPMEWYSDRLAPRAADWDGDGVKDLISGSMGKRLYFLKGKMSSDGLRFLPNQNFQFDGKDLDLPDRLFPLILNWDQDSIPDMMVSTDPGHVVVYKGDRTLNLQALDTLLHTDGSPIILMDYWERKKGNRSGFALADWNKDGYRDLIIYQFHRGVFLFLNDGNDRYGKEQLLVPLYSHLAGPSIMDWDNDGYLDLIIGGDERRMIETTKPAHLVVYHGQDLLVPPAFRNVQKK